MRNIAIASRPVLKSEVTSEVINGDMALLQANWSLSAPDGTLIAEGSSTEVAKKLEHGGWGYLIDRPSAFRRSVTNMPRASRERRSNPASTFSI